MVSVLTISEPVIVTHFDADDDGLLGAYIAQKFMPGYDKAPIVFVNAGECLVGRANDPRAIHIDTGGGQFDQHSKPYSRTCSALLLAQHLGVDQDPGIVPLLEMATATDNIEPRLATDLHHLIIGLKYKYRDSSKEVDWSIVLPKIFELFDCVYNQERSRAKSPQELASLEGWRTDLSNGKSLGVLLGRARLREAAFDNGVDVVVWYSFLGRAGFYTGVQVKRGSSLTLESLAACLRKAEAELRHYSLPLEVTLTYVGRGEPVPQWYLHDSLRLILNGSQSWKLQPDEFTHLRPKHITEIVKRWLASV